MMVLIIYYRYFPKILDGQVWQIEQTQIRLLIEEQSDQGLHYLQFPLLLLDALLWGKAILFSF